MVKLDSIWSIVGAVSIRVKVMGIAAVCILITATTLAWRDHHDFSAALRHQLQQRGISLAAGLAAQSRDFILTDNQFSLYTLAKTNLSADKDLAYVLIFDAGHDILVHTFDQGIPLELIDKNQLKAEEPFRVQALKTEEGIIHDIAVPILGGQAGIVRLGMSEASIKTEVDRHLFYNTLWILIVLVIGIYAASGMSAFLTKPISKLAKAAKAVGTRDFEWEPPPWAKDEIGSLGVAFAEVSEDLRLKNEMREQLLCKVLSAQEEERKRVARELHDEAGQALTAIMMDLAQLRDSLPGDATQAIERVSRSRLVAEQTLDYLRKLIYELRPEVLDELGLVAAIRSYVKNRIQVENMKVNLTFRKLHERLPPAIETTLFRVIQEAITNITRHSHATVLDIEIEAKDSAIIGTIKDDGIGFDVEMALASGKSFGLRGMRERVVIVGGELEIESKVGQGTRLIIHLPLNGK